ncbi:condensation domain-containing protein [Pseudomonas chlororaphis]|uniref:condensation domain-containing protein n=1 Tax=Pseudomonas chlororaphis TaxID=587753 RepID=UPI00240882A7|nr:condensation domain-containing protein [Pseudomonas chlororaphis]
MSEFARQQKVTVNTLVQAAWLLLLQRCTGQDTVVFGATVSGRPAELKGVEQQIGLFINTLPVVAAPRPEQSLGEWLQVVQARNLALRDFEHTPLYDVQRWAGLGARRCSTTSWCSRTTRCPRPWKKARRRSCNSARWAIMNRPTTR